jgi:transposase InsO family protein
VKIQRQDSPSPRAAGRGGESIIQLPTRSNGTGGRAETYVVHGHQSLPATTGHQTRQDVRPAQSCSSSTCSDSPEHPEPGRSQKRCRLSQPWETAVARQVVLTPTGPRPALTKADLIVTLAASVRASDADASVPRKVTSSTGPAPSELPNQLPRRSRRRKKKRAAEQRRSFGPMEGGYASASLTGPSTKQRSCYAQLEALGDGQEDLSPSTAGEETKSSAGTSQVARSDSEGETGPGPDSTAADPGDGSIGPGDEASEARVAAVGAERKGNSLYIKGSIEGCPVRFLIDTGAERSVIGADVLAQLPEGTRARFRKCSCNLLMANQNLETAPGPVLCRVLVEGREILEPFCVLRSMEGAIIGTPALEALGCYMTVAGVEVMSRRECAKARQVGVARVARVRVLETTTIPRRSEQLVLARTDSKLSGRTVMLAPQTNAEGVPDCLLVARSVTKPEKGRVVVRVCNTSDEPAVIRANQVLAEAQEVQVVETTPVQEESHELPEHLVVLWRTACERGELNESVAQQLKLLLIRYSKLFATNDNDLGRTTLVQHDIETGDCPPIRQPPRRIPGGQLKEFEQELDRMLAAGVIEPGQSPWASPVVLVRKKDGSVRFCVDYRRLNAATTFDAYPIPRIDETLEALGGTRYFSTLDLLSGYWQVGLTEKARQKAAFTTRNGLFLWNVMPFGLCNAPATFERLMETVLRGLQWKECLVYLDDVVVFARNEQEMLARLDAVFSRLSAAGLKLKPRKCSLFARETEYLGHIVSEAGIRVNPEKVSAVRDWPVPQTKSEVRSFLGTASYYRRFVRDFATIAAPLHHISSVKATWEWQEEHQRAFDELKAVLSTAPVLAFPLPDAPYVMDTDASLTGIGAVLSQVVEGKEMVLGYWSRSLSKEERNYCVTRRELLAVVEAFEHFHCYIYGRKFRVRTDHSSLTWLLNFREPKDQIARWLQRLGVYANQYTIEHRSGAKHGNADGLSRIPCRQCCREDCQSAPAATVDADIVRLIQLQSTWTAKEMAQAQEQDEAIGPVRAALIANEKPSRKEAKTWPKESKRYLTDWPRLVLKDGVMWRKWFNNAGQETNLQFVTPRIMRREVLTLAHDNRLSGHMGDAKTLERIRPRFYWLGMRDDITHWLRSCEICACRKPKPSRPHHSLERQAVSEPNERVAMDIMGPFEPPTESGNAYILVIGDYLTKWVEVFPMPDKTAERCADIFVREWVLRHGAPLELLTDQGMQFESKLFQEMCRLLNTNKLRTTAYHPQADGQIERNNKTIVDLLSKLQVDVPRNWDMRVPFAASVYRSSVHATTKHTPNRLMLGRETTTPLTLLAPLPPGTPKLHPYCQQLKELFEDAHRRAVTETQAQHKREQSHLDDRSKNYHFKVGDWVWLYAPKVQKGVPRKLSKDVWTGWWEVVKVITSCVYTVRYRDTQIRRTVNVDNLAPYVGRSHQRFPERPGAEGEDTHAEVIEEDGESNGSDGREDSEGEQEEAGFALPDERGTEPPPLAPLAEVTEITAATAPRLSIRPTRRSKLPVRLRDYSLSE